MPVSNLLNEGVRALLGTASNFLPANGLGVVRRDSHDDVVLTYADAFGVTAYRAHENDLPAAFRPRPAGMHRSSAGDLAANPSGLVESRLLHTSFSDDIRRRHGPQQVFTLPVPEV